MNSFQTVNTTMTRTILGARALALLAAAIAGLLSASLSAPRAAEPVAPRVNDALQPLTLTQAELSGEIGRRINDLVYKNYMALDLDRDFLEPFRSRPFTNEWHYIGVGKVIDAGSLFAAYTGDPKVNQRTSRLIEDLMKTRDSDGYLGHIKAQPEGRQNYLNWTLHEHEYTVLGLVHNWLATGNAQSLQYARELADYILATFPKNPHPERVHRRTARGDAGSLRMHRGHPVSEVCGRHPARQLNRRSQMRLAPRLGADL